MGLSDIMDLRHQSSAMYIIMLGGEDTHPRSATEVGNPVQATIPVDQEQKKQPTNYLCQPLSQSTKNKRNTQQSTHTSHYPSGNKFLRSCNDKHVLKKTT